MVSSGRFQLRSWVFIYFGLIAAIVLAGQPSGLEADDARAMPRPEVIVDSPLLRRDI